MTSSAQQYQAISQPVTIRPIRPTDRVMEAEFVQQLSSKNKQFRFLGGIKELTAGVLNTFYDVDFDQSAAFVAVIVEGGKETEIGVARYAPNTLDDVREMAITVADSWQDTGVGTLLAWRLIGFARSQGIMKLYSVDRADNTHMQQFADVLGMSAQQDPDAVHQVIYELAL